MQLLFVIETAIDLKEVDEIPNQSGIACAVGGHAMMTRKDNDFNSHWNRGFQQIVSDGRFSKLCAKASADHSE